jgi:hypothetical protein
MFARLLASLRHTQPPSICSSSAIIADRRIGVECDDLDLFREFFLMFGGADPARGPLTGSCDVHLSIHAQIHPKFGWFRMSGSNDLPVDGLEFSFTVTEPHGHFDRLAVHEPGWICFALRGSNVPRFAFHDRDCLFALEPQWQRGIMWYLFWRLLRTRADAIFFHASALGIFGEGTIFVGPPGAGKSTTALALAARGHAFLGDEIAGFLPSTGELTPFRRPVGIKPGPRCSLVERSLDPMLVERIEREGFVRLEVNKLFPVADPKPVPLRRIVFLRGGFAPRPSIERIVPGRHKVAELQPLMSSFLNASHSRRVFELTRLLASAKLYQLRPGDPDSTAQHIEEVFACE